MRLRPAEGVLGMEKLYGVLYSMDINVTSVIQRDREMKFIVLENFLENASSLSGSNGLNPISAGLPYIPISHFIGQLRPYLPENTESRPIFEVKLVRALLSTTIW
jgi:hypothetical protein